MARVVKQGKVTRDDIDKALISHLINVEDIRSNNFEAYYTKRANEILRLISEAMGKTTL